MMLSYSVSRGDIELVVVVSEVPQPVCLGIPNDDHDLDCSQRYIVLTMSVDLPLQSSSMCLIVLGAVLYSGQALL